MILNPSQLLVDLHDVMSKKHMAILWTADPHREGGRDVWKFTINIEGRKFNGQGSSKTKAKLAAAAEALLVEMEVDVVMEDALDQDILVVQEEVEFEELELPKPSRYVPIPSKSHRVRVRSVIEKPLQDPRARANGWSNQANRHRSPSGHKSKRRCGR